MTDRELLELAAKAYGLDDYKWREEYHCMVGPERMYHAPNFWNPLVDDGDALRLAGKLSIDIEHGDDEGPAIYAGYYVAMSGRKRYCIELVKNNACNAIRRAVTRAAADIGKRL